MLKISCEVHDKSLKDQVKTFNEPMREHLVYVTYALYIFFAELAMAICQFKPFPFVLESG